MIFKVFPKVNIFLKILGIDERGYHQLASRFCLAHGSLFDVVYVKEGDKFSLKGNFSFPWQENLITQAVFILKDSLLHIQNKQSSQDLLLQTQQLNVEDWDIGILDRLCIEVEKNIPIGSGLGGGSGDAGMLLYHINRTYFGLSDSIMYSIAKRVGCDVSFFYSQASSANVFGVGDRIENFQEEQYNFEIFTPKVVCNTSRVYQKWDELFLKNRKDGFIDSLDSILPKKDLQECLNTCSDVILKNYSRFKLNDLLSPCLSLYEDLRCIERDLGREWFFSGSGSSFFRIK